MSLQIYTAEKQPLTRHRVDLYGGVVKGFWVRHKPRELFRCSVCGRRRWAKNLCVQVYYDDEYISCRGECWPGQRAGMRRPKDWPISKREAHHAKERRKRS